MNAVTVGIDCRLAGTQHGGIGRYIQELLIELLSSSQHATYHLVFFDAQQEKSVLQPLESVLQRIGVNTLICSNVVVVHTYQIPVRHYSLAEQWQMAWFWHRIHPDVVHIPHFNVPLLFPPFLPLVVTVHDLLWHERIGGKQTTLSSWMYWLKYLGYRLVTGMALWRATTVIVPSQVVKATIAHHYSSVVKKIVVIYEGVGRSWFGNQRELPIHSQSDHPFIVYVGSLYPHKNVETVIAALPFLPPNVQLYCISPRNAFAQQLQIFAKGMGLEKRIIFHTQLSDDQLRSLCARALCLIQPSTSEGFGLPGLEAMAMRVPLVTSDIPIFHEIYKTHAQYFPAHDPQACASTIRHLLKRPLTDTKLSQAQAYAKKFTWQKMAISIAQIYAKVARKSMSKRSLK